MNVLVTIRRVNSMKYEVWLYATLVAKTLTYELAFEIFNLLHKQCPSSDLQIIRIEDGYICCKANC